MTQIQYNPHRRHPGSLLPKSVHDPLLLDLVRSRVTSAMISFLILRVGEVVGNAGTLAYPEHGIPASPPVTPVKTVLMSSNIHDSGHLQSSPAHSAPVKSKSPTAKCQCGNETCPAEDGSPMPTLESMIMSLIDKSNVQVPTLLAVLVYLHRVDRRWPGPGRINYCTSHRLFLGLLIVAAKYLNDSSPKNKYWTRYAAIFSQADTSVLIYRNHDLSIAEYFVTTDRIEMQLLQLLDYDLRISEEEIMHFYSPFFRHAFAVAIITPASTTVEQSSMPPTSAPTTVQTAETPTAIIATRTAERVAAPPKTPQRPPRAMLRDAAGPCLASAALSRTDSSSGTSCADLTEDGSSSGSRDEHSSDEDRELAAIEGGLAFHRRPAGQLYAKRSVSAYVVGSHRSANAYAEVARHAYPMTPTTSAESHDARVRTAKHCNIHLAKSMAAIASSLDNCV